MLPFALYAYASGATLTVIVGLAVTCTADRLTFRDRLSCLWMTLGMAALWPLFWLGVLALVIGARRR